MKKRLLILFLLFAAACVLAACVPVTPTPTPTPTTDLSVDFYAINDFHGAVDKMSTVSGFLTKATAENKNTVLLNSGDMFQGSMESNSNYGKLLVDCMDDVGFDAFTLGNHEFDWGLEKLENLSSQSKTPFLGANIYHWDADTRNWGSFASELSHEYVVKTLDSGLKVGIIGVIGKDQITSISSQLVQTIGFKNPALVIPTLSEKLKNELDCDIVVVSAHADQDTFLEDNGFDITEYADAVFCAHSHQKEIFEVNGVPFIQGGSNGNYVSHISLNRDSNGNVKCTVKENLPYSESWPNKFSVTELIDNSNDTIRDDAEQLLAKTDGYLDRYEAIPRLACHAIADYALSEGYDITLAMVNSARANISSGEVTYTELFQALPFDNIVFVAEVSGRELLNEAKYNSVWRVKEEAIVDSSNVYYKIAVIDYLLFHQNSKRYYDYFPSAFTTDFAPVALEKADEAVYNYRHITRDFLLAQSGTMSVAPYSYTSGRTDTHLLTTAVEFPDNGVTTEIVHSGDIDDPLTVAEAVELAKTSTDKNNLKTYYVEGTVGNLSFATLSDKNKDIHGFYLRDSNGASIYIYYLAKYEGATLADNWQSVSELKPDDKLLICAKLYLYTDGSGATKAEIYSGSYCVEINGEPTN